MIDLRGIRKQHGLTIKQLGEQAGLSVGYISMIENVYRTPSVAAAKRIADVLGFDWTLFFDK